MEQPQILGNSIANPILIPDDDDEDESRCEIKNYINLDDETYVDDATLADQLQLQEIMRFSVVEADTPFVVGSSSSSSSSSSKSLHVKSECKTSNIIIIDDDGEDFIWKGKNKKQCESDSETEAEEPEFPASMHFHCSICMENKFVTSRFCVTSCSHAFCDACVGKYVAAKVEENVVWIRCPDPTCKDGTIEPAACRWVIPTDVLDRWGVALCEAAIGLKKLYCPFKECSALLIDEGDGVVNAECPHCHRMFCARCKVAWHDGINCEEFQKLGKDEREKEDLMLRKVAHESKWQRCPKCKVYVERIDGCVHIICRCGHCFCYLCGSPMSKENHNCVNCHRTW